MQTFFLKFDDEAQAIEVLANYRNEADWITASHDYALDVIGTIHRPTGEMLLGEDGEYPGMAAIDGFHANLAITELPEPLIQFAVTPANPVRIFA